ncbi:MULTISPECIES: Rv1157c family protein [Rhodococcus]|uniref:Secreted protein n=3 Tax=Rhodococcus TaxID=1827 RepID=X0Q422_RHOWR|nr:MULTISPECIES: hypothetical protein [Rhodococcus]AII05113.1 hypothetical protein EP51_11020 [Rhodococcus opacus]WAM16362.1 hypothetical protein OYT95_07005 [Rhodococcus sp. JS3073]GAF45216.1 hypothetical protein RW1_018_01260 [Rhodococcus wratislaviensis NBRC 100605]
MTKDGETVLRTRGMRRAVTALAVAAAAAMAVPAQASAQPTPPPVPEGIPVEMLASFAPAIIGAAAGTEDIAAGPQDAILDQARNLLEAPGIPPELKSTLERVITFLDGSGGGGPEIPQENAPVIAQFLYPTIGKGCIGEGADSVGTALAVPGPAQLPPPGPKAGQAGFVFTALGTSSVAAEQPNPLTVTWINLDNQRRATQNLTNEAKINPDGPATLSAIADTGPGRVLAVVSGGLTTQKEGAAPITCSFLPTVGMFQVA